MSSMGAVNGSIDRLAFITSAPWAIDQSIAQTNASGSTRPKFGSLTSSTATFTAASRTPGATPTMPIWFGSAATVPDDVVGPDGGIRVGHAAQARSAGRRIHLAGQIGVGHVDARVEHADQHRLLAGGDGVRGRGVDLIHVPLPEGERVRGGAARSMRVGGVVSG